MRILLTVCARAGSKRVKDKNTRLVAGKPLIAYTIDYAKKWGKARLVCSTDSPEIARIAKDCGAEVPFMRPAELASDSAGKLQAIRNALVESEKAFEEKYDLVVDLDVTSPIRAEGDLDKCIQIMADKKADSLTSVVHARRNPYFNMVELNPEGFAELSKKLPFAVTRSQDAPEVYEENASIYVYTRDFLLSGSASNLASGRVAVYVMPELSRIDIDSELDLEFLEFLINEKVWKP